MEFYRIFLIEYSLIGIVKPKFTRRNDYLEKNSLQPATIVIQGYQYYI